MINFSNCKINLGLQILGKRDDGFHEVETVLYPVPLYDILEIIPSPNGQFKFESSGLEIPGNWKNNLVVKAYDILKKDYNLPLVHIHLHKTIPMGAGLGGGSANAAFTLKMLNEIFELKMQLEELEGNARKLGSDCAFFIRNQVALAIGKGDQLKLFKLDLSDFYIVIIKPEIHIPTADAYSWVKPKASNYSLLDVIKKPVEEWKYILTNDFEAPIFEHHPEIGQIKNQLYKLGAEYASLTGSGAAVFGIFRKRPTTALKFPGCFIWQSK